MDNSDDYFDDDDFILDEETAAALDESERRYATQAPPKQAPPPPPRPVHVQPVTKRQRTNTGWTPGFGARTESLTDMDLPDITIQGNGYAISNSNSSGAGNTSYNVQQQPAAATRRTEQNFQYQRHQETRQTPNPAVPYRPPVTRPLPPQRNGYSNHRAATPVAQGFSRAGDASFVNARPAVPTPNPLEVEMRQLQAKLEELRKSNEKMQAELNHAIESKMAKEGEVTILRKTIEKNAQNHAGELARLKAAKEEADAQILRAQKAKQEEVERLKTQFMFKQQEMEANLRKPPGSVRSKNMKVSRELPATPQASSSRGTWNIASQRPAFNLDVQQTPSRRLSSQAWPPDPPRFPSPKKQLFKSPEKPKPKLPGFQNAFAATSTPAPLNQRKGKVPEHFDVPMFSQPPPTIQPSAQPFLNVSQKHEPSLEIPMASPVRRKPAPPPPPPEKPDVFAGSSVDQDGDVPMDMDEDVFNPDDFEDVPPEILPPFNWKAELSRIMLTHLLSANVEDENNPDRHGLYIRAYSSMINVLSYPTNMDDFEQTLDIVCSACLTMAQVLSSCSLVTPLASLFSLLEAVTWHVPMSRSRFCRQDSPETPNTFDVVTSVIATHLTSAKTNADAQNLTVGIELAGFLETLAIDTSEDGILRFEKLLGVEQYILTLLDPSQPLSLLAKATQVVALLATHPTLHRALLSIYERQQGGSESTRRSRVILERMCSFLLDHNIERGPECQEVRINVIAFLSQLTMQPESLGVLTSSPIPVPSLVCHLYKVASPLYEEDQSKNENCSSTVMFLGQSVFLLNYIITADPSFNLRHKLQHAPPRPFNSVLQMFVVTFGRLAYSTAPEWFNEHDRTFLSNLAEMAVSIFEAVVDGPEGDGVWSTFQEGSFHDVPDSEDEAEMEAELS
ncbi:hypothetical protein CC1G_12766 [Coprinopsis cinerea okayama7|uniref:DNA repair protein Rad26 n=1 Tax=Coprinopsis cinerea (strain Okayama-7 / 130 / ATCC MYA-4618 / FGSC 9003) TaxID=240176 RepID=A8N5U2_COPC7|nr:hypothetical protein CC1G_12766 [Coprinopsis cinerea okayama7\|eukprot:XP_001830237.2 hypothetical protein CC1G_12766 [Coprinopsis cinerea okayama7\